MINSKIIKFKSTIIEYKILNMSETNCQALTILLSEQTNKKVQNVISNTMQLKDLRLPWQPSPPWPDLQLPPKEDPHSHMEPPRHKACRLMLFLDALASLRSMLESQGDFF